MLVVIRSRRSASAVSICGSNRSALLSQGDFNPWIFDEQLLPQSRLVLRRADPHALEHARGLAATAIDELWHPVKTEGLSVRMIFGREQRGERIGRPLETFFHQLRA